MLSLKSRKWVKLHHAYGSGANIPALLHRLITSTDWTSAAYDELWDDIWNFLCHQGVVGSASYAAVPHIVDLAARLPRGERFTYLHFVGHVEVFRVTGPEPHIPDFLQQAYVEAHRRAIRLILDCLEEEWPTYRLQVFLGTVATLQGKPQLGAGISWLHKQTSCPTCSTEFPTNGYSFFIENTMVEEGIVEWLPLTSVMPHGYAKTRWASSYHCHDSYPY